MAPSPKQLLCSTSIIAVLLSHRSMMGRAYLPSSCSEMDDVRKDRCGGRRISEDACSMLGCCWSPPVVGRETTVDGRHIPWCYYSSAEEPLSIIDNNSSNVSSSISHPTRHHHHHRSWNASDAIVGNGSSSHAAHSDNDSEYSIIHPHSQRLHRYNASNDSHLDPYPLSVGHRLSYPQDNHTNPNVTSQRQQQQQLLGKSHDWEYPHFRAKPYALDSYVASSLSAARRYHHPKSYPTVYYSVLATRSKFMKIHLQYCNALLELKYVSEVHLWDFTSSGSSGGSSSSSGGSSSGSGGGGGGKDADRDFLLEFVRDTNHSGYRLFQKPSHSTDEQVNNHYDRAHYLWGSFYEHYLTNKRYRADDVLIKADDNVVFIDISYFPKFVESVASYKKNNVLHFPNIINNDVGFVVQAMRMNDKVLDKWYKYYKNNHHVNFEDMFNSYYPHHRAAVNIEPITTWSYGVYRKPEFAFDMHNLFLLDPKSFVQNMVESKLPKVVELKRRIAINMYAAQFSAIHKVYREFLDKHCCDGESFIGFLPLLTKSVHMVHVDFVVSHFAFPAQYSSFAPINAALNTILDMYRNGSLVITAATTNTF